MDEQGGRSSGRARRSNNNCLSDGSGDGPEDLSSRSTQLLTPSTPRRTPGAITIIRLHYRFITFAMMTTGADVVDIVDTGEQRSTTSDVRRC